MKEYQRLSLIIQSLAVGVGLFIALTWVFSLTTSTYDDFHALRVGDNDVYPYKARVYWGWIATGLPFVITLGIVGVMIRCLFRKSK